MTVANSGNPAITAFIKSKTFIPLLFTGMIFVLGLVPTVNLVGYINEASGSTDGLLVQSTYHCQLNMPEPVGWKIPLVSFLQLALSN